MTHICVGYLTIICSDNGLSPGRRQSIIWSNAGILLIRPLGTNFSEMLIEILTVSLKKMYWKGSPAKWRPFYFFLNVLNKAPRNVITWEPIKDRCAYTMRYSVTASSWKIGTLNTLRPRQNGRYFAGDIFKWIFLNGSCCILIRIPGQSVRKGAINNKPALVHTMA